MYKLGYYMILCICLASPGNDSDDHSGSSGAPTPAVEKSSSAPAVDKLSES